MSDSLRSTCITCILADADGEFVGELENWAGATAKERADAGHDENDGWRRLASWLFWNANATLRNREFGETRRNLGHVHGMPTDEYQ